MTIEINNELLRRSKVPAKRKIHNERYKIPQKVRAAGNNSGLEQNVLEAIVESVGIQDVVTKSIAEELNARGGHEFGLIFSSYVGAQMGNNMLAGLNGGFGEKSRGEDYFEDKHINFNKSYPLPLDEMLITLSSALDYPYQHGVVGVAQNYFDWITRESKMAIERGDYNDFEGAIQKEKVQVGNLTFSNVNFIAQTETKKGTHATEWDHLGGYEEVKQYFKDFVTLIEGVDHCSDCKSYMSLDDRLDKGTLLFGPPGTGKTDMISIFTHQAGIPYDKFSVGSIASDFKDRRTMNIKGKFEMAARQVNQGITPVYLIYITEIDAIAGKRSSSSSNEDNSNAASEMLNYMRGIASTPGVVVVADSNRPEGIDPAFLSAGRFSRIFVMNHPTQEESPIIMKSIVKRKNEKAGRQIFKEMDFNYLASLCDNSKYIGNTKYHDLIRANTTGGYVGGDFNQIINNLMQGELLNHLKTGEPINLFNSSDFEREIKLYDKKRGIAS